MAKSSFWKRYKKRLIEKHGKTCHYCGAELKEYSELVKTTPLYVDDQGCTIIDVQRDSYKNMATVDHVIPQSKGGTNDIDNLVPCCFSCNAKKKDR